MIDGVAGDMLEGILDRDPARPLADHDAELDLVIILLQVLGLHDRLLVADVTVGEAHKDHGLARRLDAGLGRVIGIVEADREDFAGFGDHGEEAHLAQSVVGLGALDETARGGKSVAGEQRLQGRILLAETASQIKDAARHDGTVAGAALVLEAHQFHGEFPFRGGLGLFRRGRAAANFGKRITGRSPGVNRPRPFPGPQS